MDNQQYSLAFCIVLVFLAGTVRAIRFNLARRPAERCPFLLIWVCRFFESAFWLGSFLSLIIAAPHPITPVLVVMLRASLLVFQRLRFEEERTSLNRWIRIASDHGRPLTVVLERLSEGYRTSVGNRAKSCALAMIRGRSFEDAVLRSKLPLNIDTLAKATYQSDSGSGFEDTDRDDDSSDHAPEEAQLLVQIHQSMTYLFAMVLLAWGISLLIRQFITPMIRQMADEWEFGFGNNQYDYRWHEGVFERVVEFGDFGVIVAFLWILSVMALRFLPVPMARLVPWLGRTALDHWRSQVFDTLGKGMGAGAADADILAFAARNTHQFGVQLRCRRAIQFLGKGLSLPKALRRSGLLSKREMDWLECAEKNRNLRDAILRLGDDIERRQVLRWRFRLTYIVPATTVLVGGFVFVHVYFVIRFLSEVLSHIA